MDNRRYPHTSGVIYNPKVSKYPYVTSQPYLKVHMHVEYICTHVCEVSMYIWKLLKLNFLGNESFPEGMCSRAFRVKKKSHT